MELEVGDGLTGEEVVVEAAHRRRHRFIDGLIWYKEIIKMHHTHDHQNAAAGANTSLAHHEQGH